MQTLISSTSVVILILNEAKVQSAVRCSLPLSLYLSLSPPAPPPSTAGNHQ
jgi:hypothetical protein